MTSAPGSDRSGPPLDGGFSRALEQLRDDLGLPVGDDRKAGVSTPLADGDLLGVWHWHRRP